MSSPTVLYVGGFELPDENAAAQRVLGNACLMRFLGYEVVLLGVTRDPHCSRMEPVAGGIDGFRAWVVPYPSSTKAWMRHLSSFGGATHLVGLVGGVAAVFCYNYPALALWKMWRHCREMGIACVGDCTEWYGDSGGSTPRRVARWADTCTRMRILHKRLAGMVCVSECLRQYYSQCVPTVLVPPLVDVMHPKWGKPAGNRVSQQPIILLYSGSPGLHKDRLDVVVDAVSSLGDDSNTVLRIAGLTQAEYLEVYPGHGGRIESCPGRVQFLGRITHHESLKELRSASYFVFMREHSRANECGFPTKFVESVSAGIPVITTACSDIGTYVSSGVNGYLVDCDAQALAAVLQRISSHGCELRERIDPRVFDYRAYSSQLRGFMAQAGVQSSSDREVLTP